MKEPTIKTVIKTIFPDIVWTDWLKKYDQESFINDERRFKLQTQLGPEANSTAISRRNFGHTLTD